MAAIYRCIPLVGHLINKQHVTDLCFYIICMKTNYHTNLFYHGKINHVLFSSLSLFPLFYFFFFFFFFPPICLLTKTSTVSVVVIWYLFITHPFDRSVLFGYKRSLT